MYGWAGRVLYVDLTRGKVVKQPLDEKVARLFLGGRGLNDYVLFKMIKPGIDPLSPENVLCIANGVLAGTPLASTSRTHVSTLSPLTGILGDGSGGGSFSAMLKYAGYDQIVVTGRAEKPVYIWIEDDHVEIRDASSLWGLTVSETTDALRDEHGKDIAVACIGPAGEHLVRMASTMIDKYHNAARGSGAVWGSKNLKAIAVRGTKGVELADPEKFYQLAMEDLEFIKNHEFVKKIFGVIGTHYGLLNWYPAWRYYQKYLGPEDLPKELWPQEFAKYTVSRTQCFSCPIPCADVYKTKGGYGAASHFSSLHGLATNTCILDAEAALEAERLSDEYGMDGLILGDTIAFAIFLYEKGIITDTDTGGLKLRFGDPELVIELIKMIAYRKGFGNKLAEGYRNFAKLIGEEALQWCYDVKGTTWGWYTTDFNNGVFTLAHATSTRGADHLKGRSWAFWENDRNMHPELMVKLVEQGLPDFRKDPINSVIYGERACAIADSLGRCKGAINNWPMAVPLVWKYPLWKGVAMLLTAATGVTYTEEDVVRAADRIYLLEIAFNIRQGVKKKHWRIPLPPDFPEDKAVEEVKKHYKMVEEYLRRRGCDPETTYPKRETLEKLNLEFVAEEIEGKEYPDWDGPPLWPLDKYPRG